MNSILRFGKVVRALAVVVAVGTLSGTAFAGAGPKAQRSSVPEIDPGDTRMLKTCSHLWDQCSSVPEIDPGSAASAITLLVGGLLTLGECRRAK